MKNATQNALLATSLALSSLLTAGTTSAQEVGLAFPFEVQPDPIELVLGEMPQGDLGAALRAALATPGDSIELKIEGDISGAIGAKIGLGLGVTVAIKHNDDGKFELIPQSEVGLNTGIEYDLVKQKELSKDDKDVGAKLNVKGALSAGIQQTFEFDTPEEAAQGILFLGLLCVPVDLSQLELDKFADALYVLENQVGSITDLQQLLDTMPPPIKQAPVWQAVSQQSGSFDMLVLQVRDMLTQRLAELRGMLELLPAAQQKMLNAYTGFEVSFKRSAEAEVEISLKDLIKEKFGVELLDLDGFQLGAKAGVEEPYAVQFKLENGEFKEIEISYTRKTSASVSASMLIGSEMGGVQTFKAKAQFVRTAGSWQLNQEKSGVELSTDAYLKSLTKIGIDGSIAVARKSSLSLSLLQLQGVTGAVEQLLEGNPADLMNALFGTEVTFKVQDRMDFVTKVEAKAKVLGNGVKISAEFKWQNQSMVNSVTAPIEYVLPAMMDALHGSNEMYTSLIDVQHLAELAIDAMNDRLIAQAQDHLQEVLERLREVRENIIQRANEFLDWLRANDLQDEIEAMRRLIQAERDLALAGLTGAQSLVDTLQAEVSGLQASIGHHNYWIRVRQNEISAKRRWYDAQAWYNKTWAWSVYIAYSGWRSADIVSRRATVAGLEVTKTATLFLLDGAEQALANAMSTIDSSPIDNDPRIRVLSVANEAMLVPVENFVNFLENLPTLPF